MIKGICLALAVLGLTSIASAEALDRIYENQPGLNTLAQVKAHVGGGPPKCGSIAIEHRTFEGIFIAAADTTKLAIYSDDGCDVFIDGVRVHHRFQVGQHLPNLDASVYVIDHAFAAGGVHHVRVEYSNIIYRGAADTDGLTLLGIYGGGDIAAIDVDIDSDNSAQYAPPDRSSYEETVEDIPGVDATPGKVMLVDDSSTDGDYVPDYADGYDVEPLLDEDDQSAGTQFVPVVIELIGDLDPSEVQVVVTYSACDPMAIGYDGHNVFALPADGSLRLWTKDGAVQRSGASIDAGGDYVAPGAYTPTDLGVAGGQVTLYAEVVKPSAAAGDLRIEVELVPTSAGSVGLIDAVRMTGTRLEIESTDLVLGTVYPAVDVFPVGLPDVEDDNNFDPGPVSLLKYRAYVDDPRDSLDTFEVAGVALPMTKQAGRYITSEFAFLTDDDRALLAEDKLYRLTDSTGVIFELQPSTLLAGLTLIDYAETVSFRYNPQTEKQSKPPYKPTRASDRLVREIDDVVAQMELDEWVPANPADSGAFGKAVHANVTDRLRAKTNWAMDVVVDQTTRQVISIDSGPGGAGTIQVDVIALDKGYSLKVGEVIDGDRIFVYEIKNSIKGSPLTRAQRARLKIVSGGREIGLVRSSRIYHSGAWKSVPKLKTSLRVLGFLGAAVSIHAMINIDVYEDQRLELVDAIHEARDAPPGEQKRLASGAAIAKMQAYIANFLPDHEVLTIATYNTLMKVMTD